VTRRRPFPAGMANVLATRRTSSLERGATGLVATRIEKRRGSRERERVPARGGSRCVGRAKSRSGQNRHQEGVHRLSGKPPHGGVPTDSAWPKPARAAASACEPYRQMIEEALPMAGTRWLLEDLVDDHALPRLTRA